MSPAAPAALPFAEEELELSVPARLARVTARFAARPAVIGDERRLTYTELAAAANKVAHRLLAGAGNGPPGAAAPVALLLPHSVGVIVALVGALKAGRPYCALNPLFPDERNRAILADLQCRHLITDASYAATTRRLAPAGVQLLLLEEIAGGEPAAEPALALAPTTAAAIFYTSGTTGRPKGVVRDHQATLSRVWQAGPLFSPGPEVVHALLPGCSVSASVPDIFVALLNGGVLAPYDLAQNGVAGLTDWIEARQISHLHIHVAAMRQWLDGLPAGKILESLRYVRPSDRLYRRDVQQLWRHLPETALVAHSLGASETGQVAAHVMGRGELPAGEVVPVGRPVAGVEVRIVDEAGRPLPGGATGEIVVRSRFLASGYWRRPELTAASFKRDPADARFGLYRLGDLGRIRADGFLELDGRIDRRVKIRGHRLELEEIESQLERLAGVDRVAVVAEGNGLEKERLLAYVTATPGHSLSTTGLRAGLLASLPLYALPARFIIMDSLPLLANGKVNHRALPDPDPVGPDLTEALAAPRTATEKKLAAIWSAVLGIEPIGVDDNFFELGGQSLLAGQVTAQIRAAFQVELPLATLFDKATVAALARAVEAAANGTAGMAERTLEDKLRLLGVR